VKYLNENVIFASILLEFFREKTLEYRFYRADRKPTEPTSDPYRRPTRSGTVDLGLSKSFIEPLGLYTRHTWIFRRDVPVSRTR